MKKKLLIIGIAAIVICVYISGCNEQTNDNNFNNTNNSNNNSYQNGLQGKIAFVSVGSLYLMNADGTDKTVLIQNNGSNSVSHLLWSPDGSKMAFLSKAGFCTVDVDGSNIIKLPAGGRVFHWAPNGESIIISSESGIHKINADGSGMTTLTTDWCGEGSVYSPDGTKIAYFNITRLDFSNFEHKLYIMNSDGTNKVKIIDDDIDQKITPSWGLAWSPDGNKIAYLDYGALYTVSIDGSNKSLLDGYDVQSPAWSPNSDKIAYYQTGIDKKGLYVITLGSNDIKKVASVNVNADTEIPLSWSPDGKKIVFCTGDYGNGEIFTVNADGTDLKNLGYGFHPQWSPN